MKMNLQEKGISKEVLLERASSLLENYGNLSVYYNPENITDTVYLNGDGNFINQNGKPIKVRRVSIGGFCKIIDEKINEKKQVKLF